MSLRVADVVECTEAEGPGKRFAVWVQGCPIRCPGCCNPEMFPEAGGTDRDPAALADEAIEAAKTSGIEGVSILGGEPFAQAAACAVFAERARASGLSVMVFSGYVRAELEARGRAERALLAACDLLVDGRFERDLLDPSRRFIGSSNQVMHFLSDRYAPGDPRLSGRQTAEIRLRKGSLSMNGWPGLVPSIRPIRKGGARS